MGKLWYDAIFSDELGGDKSKVILSGHGSGAMSVGYHLLSTKSSSLIAGAILQSGAPLFDGHIITNDQIESNLKAGLGKITRSM